MRKIITKDIFTMARIIGKAQLKDKLSEIAIKAQKKNVKIEDIGIETIFTIIEGAGSVGVEQEVYKFLEDICEVKDIEHMEIEKLINVIKELAEENNLVDFLKIAGRLN